MKISKSGSGKTVSKPGVKKAERSDGADFLDVLKQAAKPSGNNEVSEASIAQPIDTILSLQEIQDNGDSETRKKAKQYGIDLLDRLDEIREGLLLGIIPKEQLMELAHSMRQKRKNTNDLQLNQIINEIELRAEVEIAKLTRSV